MTCWQLLQQLLVAWMMREPLMAVMSHAAGMIQIEPVWNPWYLAQQRQQLASLELSNLIVLRLMLPASRWELGCMGEGVWIRVRVRVGNDVYGQGQP